MINIDFRDNIISLKESAFSAPVFFKLLLHLARHCHWCSWLGRLFTAKRRIAKLEMMETHRMLD